jgi:hypothetical protein
MNEIAAVVYDLLISQKISGNQREVASDHVTQARVLLKSGRMTEAREVLSHLASIVTGWQKDERRTRMTTRGEALSEP